jgi:hypothetical protein
VSHLKGKKKTLVIFMFFFSRGTRILVLTFCFTLKIGTSTLFLTKFTNFKWKTEYETDGVSYITSYLSTQYDCDLFFLFRFLKAGIPDGVINVVPGFGPTAGAAVSSHMDIDAVIYLSYLFFNHVNSVSRSLILWRIAVKCSWCVMVHHCGRRDIKHWCLGLNCDYDRARMTFFKNWI